MNIMRTAMAAVFVAGATILAISPASASGGEAAKIVNGAASWYGGKFHGRTTASGERFDQAKLTAAHKTLRFGTLVRVTNRANGRSVTVKINDRGPHVRGRVIDLSRGAASKIGMVSSGVANISMQVID